MIVIVAGTNRPNSRSGLLARGLAGVYRGLGEEAEVLDLVDLPPEVYLPSAYAEKPKDFEPFADAVRRAAGLVFVVPEYNGGPPGALKYFIDMLPTERAYGGKPCCLVGLAAGVWGGLRPVEQMQHILGYRDALVFPKRVFIPRSREVIDGISGRVTDPEVVERLESQALGFCRFVAGMTPAPAGSAGPSTNH